MAEKGGSSGKGRWPDMRSLRWPPEGVEVTPGGTGSAGAPVIPPFELAPDPRGTGAVIAVPIPEVPPEIVTLSESLAGPPVAAVASSPEGGGQASVPDSVVAPAPVVAEGACQAVLIVSELRALRGAVEALTAAIAGISGAGVGGAGPRPATGTGVVPVRVVSDHQARAEIQEYFLRHQGETLYPAQLADALNLPVLKVAELCEALALRGQISRNLVS